MKELKCVVEKVENRFHRGWVAYPADSSRFKTMPLGKSRRSVENALYDLKVSVFLETREIVDVVLN